MVSDERQLIDALSFLSDHTGTAIGHATKLIDYEGDDMEGGQ
jgi:hypothetical protein